jgi:hypothetical protein
VAFLTVRHIVIYVSLHIFPTVVDLDQHLLFPFTSTAQCHSRQVSLCVAFATFITVTIPSVFAFLIVSISLKYNISEAVLPNAGIYFLTHSLQVAESF